MTGASGKITVGITGGVGGSLVVVWVQRYEVGAAYSSVDVTVKFTRTGSAYDGTFWSNTNGAVRVNGEEIWRWVSEQTSIPIPETTGEHTVAQKTIQVTHTGAIAVPVQIDGNSCFNHSQYIDSCEWKATTETITLQEIRKKFLLTISRQEGTQVTVTRDGVQLQSGADILDGEVLTVSYTLAEGYEGEVTVNGREVASGTKITVNANVAIIATARLAGCVHIGDGRYQVYIGAVRYIPMVGSADGKQWIMVN